MDGETDGQTAGRERAGSVQALLKRERGSARTKHRRRFISCQRWAGKGDPSGRACVLPPLRTPALGPPLPDPPPTRDPGGCSPPPSPVPQLGKGPYHPASPPPPPKASGQGGVALALVPVCHTVRVSMTGQEGGARPRVCVSLAKARAAPGGVQLKGTPKSFLGWGPQGAWPGLGGYMGWGRHQTWGRGGQ